MKAIKDVIIAAVVFLSTSWILYFLVEDTPAEAMGILTATTVLIVCLSIIGIKQEKGYYDE
jgi:hypothetical protein